MLQRLRQWFFGWFRARVKDPEQDRLIYRFWDGTQYRYADPWRVFRAIKADPEFHLENHMPAVERSEEPETTQCMEMISRAFGVQRYDGQSGLTDWELRALLEDFTDYLDGLQKKTPDGPISSSATAGPSSSSPADQNSVTN